MKLLNSIQILYIYITLDTYLFIYTLLCLYQNVYTRKVTRLTNRHKLFILELNPGVIKIKYYEF